MASYSRNSKELKGNQLKYENNTKEIPVWFTGKMEDVFAGWFKLDPDGWWRFTSNGVPLHQFDLVELTKKSRDLNQET